VGKAPEAANPGGLLRPVSRGMAAAIVVIWLVALGWLGWWAMHRF
jgi:hypothetical protein